MGFPEGGYVVFRTQQAYNRYWEGASLLRLTRSNWFDAAGSLVAFCSPTPEKRKDVEAFQHLLVCITSRPPKAVDREFIVLSFAPSTAAVWQCYR